jgi:hypothetical protein
MSTPHPAVVPDNISTPHTIVTTKIHTCITIRPSQRFPHRVLGSTKLNFKFVPQETLEVSIWHHKAHGLTLPEAKTLPSKKRKKIPEPKVIPQRSKIRTDHPRGRNKPTRVLFRETKKLQTRKQLSPPVNKLAPISIQKESPSCPIGALRSEIS